MTDEELTDLIAEAIDESACHKWNNRIGARSIIAALREYIRSKNNG